MRISGKNPRKGNTAKSLPGLVIAIRKKKVGDGAKVVWHQLYQVWCAQGVLSQTIKVDQLVPLSINNFPELLAFRDKRLTAEERLPSSDPKWQSPLTSTASSYPTVTLKTVWEQHRATYKQRTEDQSRKRKVGTRAAADAADTAIAATRADANKALSLATVTNQPAPPASSSSASSQPSRIARILNVSKSEYTVQYTEPQGNPEKGRVGRDWMDKQAAYIDVVHAFWNEQHADKEQQQQQQQDDEVADMDVVEVEQ